MVLGRPAAREIPAPKPLILLSCAGSCMSASTGHCSDNALRVPAC